MPLREKLSAEDLALVEVLEDPVFGPEFLRTTRDGASNKDVWEKEAWEYRWYQKDLLTDQRPNIVLTGGRSIGKCQPLNSRILTPNGYMSIYELRKQRFFETYALSDENKLEIRRAYITPDTFTKTYTVKTQSGYEIDATANHPILTPHGYRLVGDLNVGDLVAVATELPFDGTQSLFQPHEMRWLGYIWLHDSFAASIPIKPRFNAIRLDMHNIAQKFGMRAYESNGELILRGDKGVQSPIKQLFYSSGMRGMYENAKSWGKDVNRFIPISIRRERKEHIQHFISALFAQYAELSRKNTYLLTLDPLLKRDLQEILLRFGIETIIEPDRIKLRDDRSHYRFFSRIALPGVAVDDLQPPATSLDVLPFMRYEPIASIGVDHERTVTYAIQVAQHHNYISDNIFVHNSIVLEDKLVHMTINQDIYFPQTKENLLATTNQSQMEPILGRLITRFTTGKLLKEFLGNRINRSLGVFDFRFQDVQYLLRARIAGGNKESNLVGLHLPQIQIDEAQLFSIANFTQLMPALNAWEKRTQVFLAGVPNGLRTSAIYLTSVKSPRYVWYRVPSHNNPFYTRSDDLENIRKYGGIETDEYQQLVLGRHGSAAFTVINRDQIHTDSFPMHVFSFTDNDVSRGVSYSSLDRPDFSNYEILVAGIDTGFVDPTIISIIGKNANQPWHYLARYQLRRVAFPMQEEIIDWLDRFYNFSKIGLDIGAGGGGTQILHSYLYRPEFANRYKDRIVPVQFGERIPVGFDTNGNQLTQPTKTLGANLLVQQLQQGAFVLSNMDYAGLSQIERITKQRGMNGDDRYFIMGEKGNGASTDDHLFSSLICWAIATRDMSFLIKKKRLGRVSGGF